jgi:hypothetical protein
LTGRVVQLDELLQERNSPSEATSGSMEEEECIRMCEDLVNIL